MTLLTPARPFFVQADSGRLLPRLAMPNRTVAGCESEKRTFSLLFLVRSEPPTVTSKR